MVSKIISFIQTALQTPFDNSTNGFNSSNVQQAIEEIGASASPGFSFGRRGNVHSNSWLLNEGVPSNRAGRFVYINNPVINQLFIASENVSTFTVEIYTHLGDEVSLTYVDEATVTAARGGVFTIDTPISSGVQIALKLTSGSAKNIIAGLQLSGD